MDAEIIRILNPGPPRRLPSLLNHHHNYVIIMGIYLIIFSFLPNGNAQRGLDGNFDAIAVSRNFTMQEIFPDSILRCFFFCFSGHSLTDSEYKSSLQADNHLFFEIIWPEELQFTYKVSPSQFSPAFNHSNVRSPTQLVLSDPKCGCGFIINQQDVEGHVVLIERGQCSFVSKALRAQEAGAAGVIITDDDPDNDELFISMVDDDTHRSVAIPAGYLLGKNGLVFNHDSPTWSDPTETLILSVQNPTVNNVY